MARDAVARRAAGSYMTPGNSGGARIVRSTIVNVDEPQQTAIGNAASGFGTMEEVSGRRVRRRADSNVTREAEEACRRGGQMQQIREHIFCVLLYNAMIMSVVLVPSILTIVQARVANVSAFSPYFPLHNHSLKRSAQCGILTPLILFEISFTLNSSHQHPSDSGPSRPS